MVSKQFSMPLLYASLASLIIRLALAVLLSYISTDLKVGLLSLGRRRAMEYCTRHILHARHTVLVKQNMRCKQPRDFRAKHLKNNCHDRLQNYSTQVSRPGLAQLLMGRRCWNKGVACTLLMFHDMFWSALRVPSDYNSCYCRSLCAWIQPCLLASGLRSLSSDKYCIFWWVWVSNLAVFPGAPLPPSNGALVPPPGGLVIGG